MYARIGLQSLGSRSVQHSDPVMLCYRVCTYFECHTDTMLGKPDAKE